MVFLDSLCNVLHIFTYLDILRSQLIFLLKISSAYVFNV